MSGRKRARGTFQGLPCAFVKVCIKWFGPVSVIDFQLFARTFTWCRDSVRLMTVSPAFTHLFALCLVAINSYSGWALRSHRQSPVLSSARHLQLQEWTNRQKSFSICAFISVTFIRVCTQIKEGKSWEWVMLTRLVRRACFLNWNIIPIGPTRWNLLPLELRSATSVSSFKSKLKTYFFSQAFRFTELVLLLF